MLGDFAYAIPAIVGVVIMGTMNASLFASSRSVGTARLPACQKRSAISGIFSLLLAKDTYRVS